MTKPARKHRIDLTFGEAWAAWYGILTCMKDDSKMIKVKDTMHIPIKKLTIKLEKIMLNYPDLVPTDVMRRHRISAERRLYGKVF